MIRTLCYFCKEHPVFDSVNDLFCSKDCEDKAREERDIILETPHTLDEAILNGVRQALVGPGSLGSIHPRVALHVKDFLAQKLAAAILRAEQGEPAEPIVKSLIEQILEKRI